MLLFVLPFCLCPPSDPTLTVENVREVMAEVRNWMIVGFWLGVPDTKRQEISQQLSTARERCLALGDYLVNTDPYGSWKKLALGLYWEREERALAVTKQYLQQQGMCVLSCLLWKLWSSKYCEMGTKMKTASPGNSGKWPSIDLSDQMSTFPHRRVLV